MKLWKNNLLILSLLIASGCFSCAFQFQKNRQNIPDRARVFFAGDVMLDWGIADAIQEHGIEYTVKDMKSFLDGFDYRFCNLETPVSEKLKPFPEKKYIFLAKPEHLGLMQYSGINLVSLANNHSTDYGTDGLLNTIKYLAKSNIAYCGAGDNIYSAHSGYIAKINNLKICFFSYSSIGYDVSFADKKNPGIAKADIDRITEDIAKHGEQRDFVVISLHWGEEYSRYPSSEQVDLAHAIIDSGADVVIGHHSHIYQGIEIYRKKPIFYSLGNFIFGSINEDIRENIVAEINFNKYNIDSIRVYPVNGNMDKEKLFSYKLLRDEKAEDVLRDVQKISEPMCAEFAAKSVIKDNILSYEFTRRKITTPQERP